jgi:hypothetical protein
MPILTPTIPLDKFTTFGDLLKYLRCRAHTSKATQYDEWVLFIMG